ncbi:MAG: efflux RND transporter periplasmic adaptor subunit [Thiogranum sp.]|nr:efflux RND transporter periplasmic adaptor subunit [Thiogranum sp.]
MTRNFFLSMVAASAILSGWPGMASRAAGDDVHEQDADAAVDEIPEGPHGGKLFEKDGFAIELVLYETGVPPEFHAYASEQGELLAPQNVDLTVELTRVDGEVDRFEFKPLKAFLRGQGVVREPHSFDVDIEARHDGKTFHWHYSTYEGRTEIPDELAQDAGIKTEIAGPATLAETLVVTGRVQADPAHLAEVRARFPGIVQRIDARLGQTVSEGEVLARIQSNESLQTYTLKAPIGGVILRRKVQLNMVTGAEPLFVIVDLSQVWVELDIFSRHIGAVKAGQPVRIETLNGVQYTGRIDWVAPLAAHASQSVQARVILDNANGELRPGQFVRGQITVAEHPVELAVRQSAIQRFRDFRVVFARFGETYEVRMLELGRQNSEWAEVLGGLAPGTEYVTANSYLIKADIEKSGASHDH